MRRWELRIYFAFETDKEYNLESLFILKTTETFEFKAKILINEKQKCTYFFISACWVVEFKYSQQVKWFVVYFSWQYIALGDIEAIWIYLWSQIS